MAEFFSTGKPCQNGHMDQRYASTGLCVTCVRDRFKRNAWAEKNKERRKQHCKKYRDANSAKTVAASLASIRKNPSAPKAWKDANAEKVREAKRAWQKRNPEYGILQKHRRRVARPDWVDVRELATITRECRRISIETGIAHHVDHIVPLVGKTVCGLDVPWNLQIIPAEVNQRKSNKVPDDVIAPANDMHRRHGLYAVTEALRAMS